MLRRRGIRVFALIAVIIVLSVLTLSFKDIDISFLGADLEAHGNGPLGLTLGLDLQGGSHLVYQADVRDEVTVTFQEAVAGPPLKNLLDELRHTQAVLAKKEFSITGLSLDEGAEEALRVALDQDQKPVESFTFIRGLVEVTFQEEVDPNALRDLLVELGHADTTIVSQDNLRYAIAGLSLGGTALEELRGALEESLAPVDAVSTGDGLLQVIFQIATDDGALSQFLERQGLREASIESPVQKEYLIRELSLDEITRDELEAAISDRISPLQEDGFIAKLIEPTEDEMKGVQNTIQRRINALGTTEPIIQRLGSDRVVVQLPGAVGTSVNVTFVGIADVLNSINTVLVGVGHMGGGTIEPTGGNSFIIRTDESLSMGDLEALDALAGDLGPNIALESSGDKAIVVTLPLPPTEATLANLLGGLGHAKLTIQQRDANNFVIRTDDVLPTEDQDEIRDVLEAQVAGINSFVAAGGIEEAKRLIGSTAELVFKQRECFISVEDQQAAQAAGLPDPCSFQGNFIDTDIGLTGADLNRAFLGRDPTTNEPLVNLEFNSQGIDILRDVVPLLFDIGERGRLVIFLDGLEISAPVVRDPTVFRDGTGVISGGFTTRSARELAIQLESGRLDVPLTLIRESTVDALLGSDSLRKSLIAGILGLGLVLMFMTLYYRMAGLVAAVSLMVYAVIVLAILKLIPVTLTLSSVAGLVLSIGMAVDANILIFERMKEELRSGRSLTSSMEVGFRRAWVAIRDSNISTIITCAVLFLFGSRLGAGTPVVTGLAVTLLIGVLVSMFTAIMVSRNLLQIMAWTPMGRRMSLFTPESRRQPVRAVAGGK